MKIPHDYHLHSLFSGDNQSTMQSMCEAAIERDIPEICFTEHFDVHPKEPLRLQFPLKDWANELERCRQLFAGQLIIRAGLEFSEPHKAPPEGLALLERYPFDLIIGSLHWVGDQVVFDPEYFKRPMDEAYQQYFIELEHMTQIGGFDILGHLDIVARLGYEIYKQYTPTRYETLIRPVLQNCIDNQIAIDVNAGNIRRPLGRLLPDIEILRWYVEMGGKQVIFSSDAHKPEQVGVGLERAVAAAQAVGLHQTLQYEGRQAGYVPFDYS